MFFVTVCSKQKQLCMWFLSCKHTHLFEMIYHLYFKRYKLFNYKYVYIVKPSVLRLNNFFFFFFSLGAPGHRRLCTAQVGLYTLRCTWVPSLAAVLYQYIRLLWLVHGAGVLLLSWCYVTYLVSYTTCIVTSVVWIRSETCNKMLHVFNFEDRWYIYIYVSIRYIYIYIYILQKMEHYLIK